MAFNLYFTLLAILRAVLEFIYNLHMHINTKIKYKLMLKIIGSLRGRNWIPDLSQLSGFSKKSNLLGPEQWHKWKGVCLASSLPRMDHDLIP